MNSDVFKKIEDETSKQVRRASKEIAYVINWNTGRSRFFFANNQNKISMENWTLMLEAC